MNSLLNQQLNQHTINNRNQQPSQPPNQPLVYDVIIVGSGPAGLTASIYASRYKLSNIVLGKQLGGELSLAHRVENYPGYLSISGLELAAKWQEQVEKLGAKVLLKEVGKIGFIEETSLLRSTDQKFFSANRTRINNDLPSSQSRDAVNTQKENFRQSPRKLFSIQINENEIYYAKTIIVATGSERRRLNIPGEKEYMGRGVSYCHTCDAPFFKGKTVAIVGGSDSAVTAAVHTSDYASKVYVVYRGEKLRAEPMWIEEWKKIEASGKGQTIYNTNLVQILGDTKVTGAKLDQQYKGNQVLPTDGVFIEIGGVPGTTLVQPLGVKVDETGHVVVTDKMETNIEGLFCVGDMINKSSKFKQAIWAMSQGAMAAACAYECLKKEAAPAQRGI